MIVRVNPGVMQTCVRIDSHQARPFICRDLRVQISRVTVHDADCTTPLNGWSWCDAARHLPPQAHRLGIQNCAPAQQPVLEYPAHATDEEGRVCFHWDDLLYNLPSGRYTARIIDQHRQHVSSFEIELSGRSYTVADHTNIEAAPRCGECE